MRYLALLIAISAASFAPAQMHAQHPISPNQLKWGPPPPMLPKGCKMAVLQGDPSKEGLFTIRAKMPTGYKVPPHWHSTDEMLTVISGHLYMGMADKIDLKHAHLMGPGS